MKRIPRNLLIAVPVIVVVGAVAAYLVRNAVARSLIEEGSTRALGVDTSLDGVEIDVVGQGVSMADYRVANPEEFGDESFLSLERGHLEIDGGTVLSDRIRIPDLELEGIELRLVQAGRDGNYRAILDNIHEFQQSISPGGDEPSDEGARGGKKLWIDRISIRNVRVSVRVELPGRAPAEGAVEIDELVLNDVGGDDGVGIGELVATIAQGLLESTLAASRGELPSILAAGIRQRLDQLPALSSVGIDLQTKGARISLQDLDADSVLGEAKKKVLEVLTGGDAGGR